MTRPAPFPFPVTEELTPALRQEVLSRRSLSVYRMIMHTPAVAPAFLMLSDALRHQTSLPGNWRELAILRVGHRYQAAYEIHHHERLGRSVGLSEAAIAATRPGGDQTVLDATEQFIIALVDELLQEHGLSDASRARALETMTANQLADLVLTVGFYQLVCNFLTTFGVPIEAPQ
jgi:4-carboxymuconolactone decarboxylase